MTADTPAADAQLGEPHTNGLKPSNGSAHQPASSAEGPIQLFRLAQTAAGQGIKDRSHIPLRELIRQSGAGWRLLIVLALMAGLDQAITVALAVLAPEIKATLGISGAAYGIIVSQRSTAAVLVSLQMAWHINRTRTRRTLLVYAAASIVGGMVLSSLSRNFWPLLLAVGLTGPTAGAVWALHRPMIMDGYPPAARVRAMGVHEGAVVVGAVVGPFLVALLAGGFGLTWRGIALVLALLAMVPAIAVVWVRDPKTGRWDTEAARQAVQEAIGTNQDEPSDEARLSFTESVRQLWLIPTLRRLLMAWAVLGVVLTPLPSYISFLFEDRWKMSLLHRSMLLSACWVLAIPALAWTARQGDRLYQSNPSKVVATASRMMAVMALGLVAGAAFPWMAVSVVGIGIALAASAAAIPPLVVTTLSVVHPRNRANAGFLVAAFLVAVGGEGGAMFLGGLDRRFGAAVAIGLLAVPALAAGLLVRRASSTVVADQEELLHHVVEEEEVSLAIRRGREVPMLACRGINFSYGQLQVLFDVDFTVREGEIVALLGTNGAGKSTLLRVISGLGLPSRGTVRLRGNDITHLDAEKRVSQGIAQVPGGRAVFGSMTVAENLKVLAYTCARNRRAAEQGIEASFAAFPVLHARRNQLASTLSGGEQQMLGLTTAFILRPQVLLIDELSLGLAPKVVSDLLEMVRQINAQGTAVVLVEQSVNVALSVVRHAYFMEKGQIRFDGSAESLLERPDLLRSVFLEGASKGLSGAN